MQNKNKTNFQPQSYAHLVITEEFLQAECKQFCATLKENSKRNFFLAFFTKNLRAELMGLWTEHKYRTLESRLKWLRESSARVDNQQGFSKKLLERQAEEIELEALRFAAKVE